jgi:hypothetical protein
MKTNLYTKDISNSKLYQLIEKRDTYAQMVNMLGRGKDNSIFALCSGDPRILAQQAEAEINGHINLLQSTIDRGESIIATYTMNISNNKAAVNRNKTLFNQNQSKIADSGSLGRELQTKISEANKLYQAEQKRYADLCKNNKDLLDNMSTK